MMRSASLTLFAAIFIGGMTSADAAPAQLYNKTVSFGWTSNSTVVDPDGRVRGVPSNLSYVIYISSTGRLFERSSRTTGRRSTSGEIDPGATSNRRGEARGLRFEGNNLVSNRGYAGAGGSGAMRAVVTFDAGFSSCAVKINLGRENGAPIRRMGLDGVVREIRALDVTSTSCSVREGNAFAY